MATELGSVSSWVSSVLTGTSLMFAAFTYFRATKDRRRALDESERAQAGRVSLWWDNPRRARVSNSNDVAVTVRVELPDGEATSEPLGLGPGETRELLLSAALEGRSADLALVITDSIGRTWIRSGGGELNRISGGTAPSPRDPTSALRWGDR